MKILKVFLISIIALILTVPWFFTDFNRTILFGFPLWALYSLVMTFLYAFIIAFLLGRYWKTPPDEKEGDF